MGCSPGAQFSSAGFRVCTGEKYQRSFATLWVFSLYLEDIQLLLINSHMHQSLYTFILNYISKIEIALHEEKYTKN